MFPAVASRVPGGLSFLKHKHATSGIARSALIRKTSTKQLSQVRKTASGPPSRLQRLLYSDTQPTREQNQTKAKRTTEKAFQGLHPAQNRWRGVRGQQQFHTLGIGIIRKKPKTVCETVFGTETSQQQFWERFLAQNKAQTASETVVGAGESHKPCWKCTTEVILYWS